MSEPDNEKEIHEIVTKNYLKEKGIPFVKRERLPVQQSALAPEPTAPPAPVPTEPPAQPGYNIIEQINSEPAPPSRSEGSSSR